VSPDRLKQDGGFHTVSSRRTRNPEIVESLDH
jgi:hypothetical protein